MARTLTSLVKTFLVVATLATASSGFAAESQLALERGRQLTEQGLWAEAADWYRTQLDEQPDDAVLLRELDRAKLHVEVARRYRDSSYRAAAQTISRREALDLYSEVMAKIDSFYVEQPAWHILLARGANSFHAAISEPSFQAMHGNIGDDARRAYVDSVRELFKDQPIRSRYDAVRLASQAADLAERTLRTPSGTALLEYTGGVVGGLDDYSAFLTPQQLADVHSQIEGDFVGLGVELKPDGKTLTVVRVIPGSPAEKAGLAAGDLILRVDGRETAVVGAEPAADLMQGVEGSVAEIVLQRGEGRPRSLRIRRSRVEIPSVEDVRLVDAARGVGYIKIGSFQKTTIDEVNNALWKLHESGMQSLIIDVRGNPGGVMTSSVELADRFIERGVLLTTRGRNAGEASTYSARIGGTWRVPLIVLIDGDSASASEIFAGAIRDHNRGEIIGDRSYGKGSVQGIFPLSYGGAGLRLTTAYFFSPSNRRIAGNGVEPTRHVAAKPDGVSDPVLDEAVRQAGARVARR